MLLSTAETYKELETFESVEALNEATRKHRSSHDLSDTETAILDVLARHSCVYKGVSYLSKSNIAKQVGRVRRTVIRACNRLEALGIIKQVAMKRVAGDKRQTSNAVVINPVETLTVKDTEKSQVVTQVTPAMSRQEARLSFKRNSSNTYTDTSKVADTHAPSSALQNSIPQAIYEALAPFYDYDGLYKAYGVLLRAKASVDRTITVEEYADTFTGIFANAIRKMKRGLIDRDKLNGYLYVAWREACTVIDRQRVYAAYSHV